MTRVLPGLTVALLIGSLCLAAAGCGDDPAEGPEARDKPVWASVRSGVYHRPDCRYARRIAEHNLRGYDDAEHAERHGLRPCKVCKPQDVGR